MPKSPGLNFQKATSLITNVCEVAGHRDLMGEARKALGQAGILKAVREHDDGVLFDWLMWSLSYQGVSDAVASRYMELHGSASAEQIAQGVAGRTRCEKLQDFAAFTACGYRKTKATCNNPKLIKSCPLPRLDLRNGGLNQAAYSLFLFMRDVAGGDFVEWIDQTLEHARTDEKSGSDALVAPLTQVHGLSFKVLNMTLAKLLLVGDARRELWKAAGAQMIAIDTLVHNWLHRTGILRGLDADHSYGPGCYGPGRCADIIRSVSQQIDATTFNAGYPRTFPRFVQSAIWRFCSQQQFDTCNGNRIDDRGRCWQSQCILFESCARLELGRPALAAKTAA
jgi:hypothetical protein